MEERMVRKVKGLVSYFSDKCLGVQEELLNRRGESSSCLDAVKNRLDSRKVNFLV
jgi:hypothetical protein